MANITSSPVSGGNTYIVGTEVSFYCEKGYTVVGSNIIKCKNNGKMNTRPHTHLIISIHNYTMYKLYIFVFQDNGMHQYHHVMSVHLVSTHL